MKIVMLENLQSKLRQTKLGEEYLSLWSLHNYANRLFFLKWFLILNLIPFILIIPFTFLVTYNLGSFLIAAVILGFVFAAIIWIPIIALFIQRLRDMGLNWYGIGGIVILWISLNIANDSVTEVSEFLNLVLVAGFGVLFLWPSKE